MQTCVNHLQCERWSSLSLSLDRGDPTMFLQRIFGVLRLVNLREYMSIYYVYLSRNLAYQIAFVRVQYQLDCTEMCHCHRQNPYCENVVGFELLKYVLDRYAESLWEPCSEH